MTQQKALSCRQYASGLGSTASGNPETSSRTQENMTEPEGGTAVSPEGVTSLVEGPRRQSLNPTSDHTQK